MYHKKKELKKRIKVSKEALELHSCHLFTLHLWKKIGKEVELPPRELRWKRRV